MKTFAGLTLTAAVTYLGCIAAAQYQPRHDTAQPQANAASQSAVASDNGHVTNTNETRQDNRTIEGQPPSYTFLNAAIDKAMLLLLIWQSVGHKSSLRRMANGHASGAP